MLRSQSSGSALQAQMKVKQHLYYSCGWLPIFQGFVCCMATAEVWHAQKGQCLLGIRSRPTQMHLEHVASSTLRPWTLTLTLKLLLLSPAILIRLWPWHAAFSWPSVRVGGGRDI